MKRHDERWLAMSTARKSKVDLGAVPEIISRIPKHDGKVPEHIHDELRKAWGDLERGYSSSKGAFYMSGGEYEAWCRFKEGDDTALSAELLKAWDKLDALILHQSETIGWRIALSPLVTWRFSVWETRSDGPELFEQYGKNLARSVRYWRREVAPPINDPGFRRFKNETIEELKTLLTVLRDHFSDSHASVSTQVLIQHFRRVVSELELVHLVANVDVWTQWIGDNAQKMKGLVGSKRRPAVGALFDDWFSWCKLRDPETVRQEISTLRPVLKVG
jgi:hypothetical protein